MQTNWPFLIEYFRDDKLIPLDILFAERLLGCVGEDLNEKMVACLAVMMWKYREGHICVDFNSEPDPLMWFAKEGADLLPESLCSDGSSHTPICRFEGLYYFQKNWVFETLCCTHMQRLLKAEITPIEVDFPLCADLTDEQRQAILQGVASPVSLLIGGPGTGKTFTAKKLIEAYMRALSLEQKKLFRLVVAAPTGKAATHLAKQIQPMWSDEFHPDRFLSGTLHALLHCKEGDDRIQDSFLMADLILVDECSMIEAKMWAQLLVSIPSGARLVLIGDPNQLPAVGGGHFFADFIEAAPRIPFTCLTRSKRVENPELMELAEALSQDAVAVALLKLQSLCLPLQTPNVFEQLAAQVKKHLFWTVADPDLVDVSEYFIALDRFRLLSCLRQGVFGVDALNQRLFEALQGELPAVGWWVIPIVIMQNHFSMGLCNGDTGLLFRDIACTGESFAVFPGKPRIMEVLLPAFEYAYCMSVHKSQGSEYEEVVLVAPPGSERFDKSILYTALTRAKKSLKIYGEVESLLHQKESKRSGVVKRL